MAGAQTSLTLQDRLTGPLTKIMKAMDSTIKVMEQMDSATQRLDKKSLAGARKNIDNASSDLNRLKSSMADAGKQTERAAQQQDKFNNSLGGGLSMIKNYAGGLLAAVGAYKVFNAGKDLLSDMFSRGVDFHAFTQASEIAFTTFLGDAKTAQQYMDNMYAFALKTPFAYPDLLESSRNLIAFGVQAENTFPIMQALGDAIAGIGGGNAEMKNMADIFGQIQAQGRITAQEVNRLSQYGVNAYEMLGQAAGVSGQEMRKQISSGAVDAGTAIAGLVEGMNDQFGGMMEGVKGTWRGAIDSMNSSIRNAGAAMMDDFMEPLTKTIGVVTEGFKKVPQYIGPAVAAFLPLLDMFNDTFGGGRFDGIFASIGASITFAATMISWLGQGALFVAGVFADNWSWIAPILTGIGAALALITTILLVKYAVIGIIRTATAAWAAMQWAVNAAYLANPIGIILLIIVGIIAMVIYAMVAWAEQTAAVIGAIVGSIFWLGTVFWNILLGIANFGILVAEWIVNAWNTGVYMIQLLWFGLNVAILTILDAIANGAITVAEFFANVWNKAVFGVQNAFYIMQKGILTVMSSVASGVTNAVNGALSVLSTLINGAISGINSLIGMINKIPGVNIGEIGDVDLKASTAAVDKLESMKSNLTAPTEAGPVSFDRVNMAGDYANANMPTAPEKASFGRLDYADPSAAFSKGQQIGSNASLTASDKLSGALGKMTGMMSNPTNLLNAGEVPTGGYDPSLGGAPGVAVDGSGKSGGKGGNPTGGKLDSIGKIDDEINIADEDLKLLLELADSRTINEINITLSPAVTFKDNVIREEADMDKIVDKINKNFEDDMERSIEGVVMT